MKRNFIHEDKIYGFHQANNNSRARRARRVTSTPQIDNNRASNRGMVGVTESTQQQSKSESEPSQQ
tara:strand:- start:1094 stop:1291 length:198 start_codon:yes stop_codon:yes gene_type:complete